MTFDILKKLYSKTLIPVVVAAIIVMGAIAAPVHANAQGIQCGNRGQMVETLGQRFKEDRFAMGLSSNVSLLELFVSKKGTWTILTTRANGKTCIVAAGKSWVSMPMKLEGDAVSLQQH